MQLSIMPEELMFGQGGNYQNQTNGRDKHWCRLMCRLLGASPRLGMPFSSGETRVALIKQSV
eukprot:9267076-Alexandrium_andersonii.AAC.1